MRLLFLIAVLALVLAGCGGGSSDRSSSATSWANGFCSAVSSWTGSLGSTVRSLQAGDLSAASVRSAVRSADGATRKLGTSLRKLGAPDTPSGQRAKQIVGTLAGRLEAEVGTIAAAVRKASGAGRGRRAGARPRRGRAARKERAAGPRGAPRPAGPPNRPAREGLPRGG